MAEYTLTLRSDNTTWGILKQYLINGKGNSTTGEYNHWVSKSDLGYPSWEYAYGNYDYAWPFGGTSTTYTYNRFKQLLYMTMPGQIFPSAEIKSIKFYDSYTNWTLPDYSPIRLRKANAEYDITTDTKMFCSQMHSCAFNSVATYTWTTSDLGTNKQEWLGNQYNATETGYPGRFLESGGNTYTFYNYIAFDDPPYGFVASLHPANLVAADTSVINRVYMNLATGGMTQLYEETETTDYRVWDDSGDMFKTGVVSGRVYFAPPYVPATMTSAQVRTDMLTVGGTPPAEIDIENGKYWIKWVTSGEAAGGDAHVYLMNVKPYYVGGPSYFHPYNVLSSDAGFEWNMDPTDASTKTNAFNVTDDYVAIPQFNSWRDISPNHLTYKEQILDITGVFEDLYSKEYMVMHNNVETSFNQVNWRKTDATNCFLEVEITFDDADVAVSKLEVVRNDADPTLIKLIWETDGEITLFDSYTVQMKETSETIWTDLSASLTSFAQTEYVIVDTDVFNDAVHTPQSNNTTFDIRLKVNLATTGYATGYHPYFYSNMVQAFRPNAAQFSALSYNYVGRNLHFGCTSSATNTVFPISKRIITWRDDSIDEFEYGTPLTYTESISNTGNAYHIYSEQKTFTTVADRPYLQYETIQGIRSIPETATPYGYVDSDCTVKDASPNSRLRVSSYSITTDDTLKLFAGDSKPTQIDDSISTYILYDSENGFTSQTSPKLDATFTTAATKQIAGICIDNNSMIGSGFEYVCAYPGASTVNTYYDGIVTGREYFASVSLTTDQSNINLASGTYQNIFLVSSTPFNGVILKLIDNLGGTISFHYWDGTDFDTELTSNASQTIDETDTTNYQIFTWDAPSDFTPATNSVVSTKFNSDYSQTISIGDTTNKYYWVRLKWTGVTSATDITIAKLTKGVNYHQVVVSSRTPTLLSSLTNTHVYRIDEKNGRHIVENQLDGDAGTELVDLGKIPTRISYQGIILKGDAVSKGHYYSGVMAAYMTLKKWVNNNTYIQVDVDPGKDKALGYITNLSQPYDGGERNVRYFQMDMSVDRWLRYINESCVITNLGGDQYSAVLTYAASDVTGSGTIDSGDFEYPYDDCSFVSWTAGTKTLVFSRTSAVGTPQTIGYWYKVRM